MPGSGFGSSVGPANNHRDNGGSRGGQPLIVPEPGLKSEIHRRRACYRIFWKHLVSTRRVIRHPSAVRRNSSSYHSPQNITWSFSPPSTIGLKQIVRDAAVAPSMRTEKLPSMCAYIGKFGSTSANQAFTCG